MSEIIRPMTAADKPHVIEMMRVFYASPAVHTDGSEEIFSADVDACLGDSPYLEGFVVEGGDGLIGYAMVAKSFSTEFGKSCIWIEDIYIRDAHRGLGLGRRLMDFITSRYSDCIYRLEVESDNARALALYGKSGFTPLPYIEMKK